MVGAGADGGAGDRAGSAPRLHRGGRRSHHHQQLCGGAVPYRRGALRAGRRQARRPVGRIGAPRRGGGSAAQPPQDHRGRIAAAAVRLLPPRSVRSRAGPGHAGGAGGCPAAIHRPFPRRNAKLHRRGARGLRGRAPNRQADLGVLHTAGRWHCRRGPRPPFGRRRRRGRRGGPRCRRRRRAVQLQPAGGDGTGRRART